MKIIHVIAGILFCVSTYAQDNNPYAVYGYNAPTVYEEPEQFFFIKNTDTTAKIQVLKFDLYEKQVYILGKNGIILDKQKINPVDIARFISVDPLADKWNMTSPYSYVLNNPISNIDPDGRDVIMLFYATGKGEEAFRASAQTRMDNIMNSKNFDPKKDIVKIMGISDLGQMKSMIEGVVSQYSEQFGQTAEVGFWSHSGQVDGPIGSVVTSQNGLDEGSGQMTMKGWGDINYNWKENGAQMDLYGCNTACNSTKSIAFANRVSALPNYSNVEVSGQTSYAYPSYNPTSRSTNLSREYAPNVGFGYGETYMVGGVKNQGGQAVYGSIPANPMGVYYNGRKVRNQYQKTGY